MELKRFQQNALDDLEEYLSLLNNGLEPSAAYERLWTDRGFTVGESSGNIPRYRKSLLSCPDACLKVPDRKSVV